MVLFFPSATRTLTKLKVRVVVFEALRGEKK